MKNIKFKLHKIIGKWVNDDVDIIPSIKFRTGSKSNETTSVTTTMVCLAWLKCKSCNCYAQQHHRVEPYVEL